MRLSRTDLVPLLTIIAGGAVGALLTFSPLVLRSPADDGLAPVRVVQPASDGMRARVRPVPVRSSDGRTIVFVSSDGRTYRFRSVDKDPEPVTLSADGQWIAYQAQPLIFIDGVSVGTFFPESLDPDDVEGIEVVKGDAAVALYGVKASAGVTLISLKEERHR